MWTKLKIIAKVVLTLTLFVFPAAASAQHSGTPASLTLQGVCALDREEIVLTWSADSAPPQWTVSRDEQVIGVVAGQDPAADVLYTWHDPGSGGEYTISGAGMSASVTVQCGTSSAKAG